MPKIAILLLRQIIKNQKNQWRRQNALDRRKTKLKLLNQQSTTRMTTLTPSQTEWAKPL